MSVKIKDIQSLLPKRKDEAKLVRLHGDHRAYWFNHALDEIGGRELTLNREKLASIFWKIERGDTANDDSKVMILENCYRYTDTIIANLKDLLEVKDN